MDKKTRDVFCENRLSSAIGDETHVELISAKVLFPMIEKLLAEGRQAAFTVTGMSMWPFLCHGRDQVVVASCQLDSLRPGDIILIQTHLSNYLLHRITKITASGFVTTGDGNCFRDGEFPFSCVKAKVTCLIRNGKRIECSGWKWKFVSWFWMFLFPIRKWIFKAWFLIRKYFRR